MLEGGLYDDGCGMRDGCVCHTEQRPGSCLCATDCSRLSRPERRSGCLADHLGAVCLLQSCDGCLCACGLSRRDHGDGVRAQHTGLSARCRLDRNEALDVRMEARECGGWCLRGAPRSAKRLTTARAAVQ